MRFAVLTAGCRLNQSESDALRAVLAGRGASPTDELRAADECFVNTCAVTARAERSSLQLVRRVCRLVPKPRVTVIGCLVEYSPERVARIAGVDELWDNGKKSAMIAGVAPRPRRSRALLRVQDGCDRDCAFCAVARFRGHPVSVPVRSVVQQFRTLLSAGFREIVLTGLNLGIYRSADGCDLVGLLHLLLEECRRYGCGSRVRLGSLEPDTVSSRLVRLFADGCLVPHLHLPLQSGDDGILRRMRRRYNSCQFADVVKQVRQVRPEVNIGIDVIAGLPGEDEQSFARTCTFLAGLGPGYLHVFSYSPRDRTAASQMRDAASAEERSRRVHVLRELSRRLRYSYQEHFVGSIRPAVVESGATALTDNYLRLGLDEGRVLEPRSIVDLLVVQGQDRFCGRPLQRPVLEAS